MCGSQMRVPLISMVKLYLDEIMRVDKVAFEDTGRFSNLFNAYIKKDKDVSPFYDAYPEPSQIADCIKRRIKAKGATSKQVRTVLSSTLGAQYAGLKTSDLVLENIARLKEENTFTVTTGHQLNIFTGPLYFIYKIVTAVNTARALKEEYPDYHFVPVYWMASEDHDFDEISYIHLFGKKYTWENDETGAVGRMKCGTIDKLLEQLPGDVSMFRDAYLGHEQLASAVRCYVNEMFREDGLVVVEPDHPDLKTLFLDVIQDDVVNHTANKLVEKTTSDLEGKGFKGQIHARDINFFYLSDGLRERIVSENGAYRVLETDVVLSQEEFLKESKEHPERFSPNVILRPLYQEMILPNLIYIGGPAEVDYWLQLKGVFDNYKVPFPIVMPRNFVLYINHVMDRKMKKSGAQLSDVFTPKHEFLKRRIKELSDKDLAVSEEGEQLSSVFEKLQSKAKDVDVTLEPLVKAELARAGKAVERIGKKMVKAEKRYHEDVIRQTDEWHDQLFPNGGDQERTLNYLNFQLEDPTFVEKVKKSLEPFDLRYHVITDAGD